nr:hypothetical protein [Tanacetum cinerariifolium]
MTESPLVDSVFAVPVFSPGDDPIACLNKEMAFLVAVASSRFFSTNNQLRTLSNPRNQATIQDGRVTVQQVYRRQGQCYSGTGYKSHATSSKGNNSSGQAKEKANKEQNNESLTAELERYKERVKIFEQHLNMDLSSRKKIIDSQMDNMIKEKLALKEQVDSLEKNLSKKIKEKECQYAQTVHMITKPQAFYDNIHKQSLGYQIPFHLKKAHRTKPTLYDGIVMSDKHVATPMIDDEETLILKEESRSRMSEKEKEPEDIKQNISHKPIDYELRILGNVLLHNKNCQLNKLSGYIVLWYLDFGCSKHMTGNRSQLMNFVSKFLGTIRFENDHIAKIMGYGDYQLRNVTISRVYCVKGLGHNMLSVGQFCDAYLEVAFGKNTCFIRNLDGVDLIFIYRDTNLYIIFLDDMLKTSSICLLLKTSKTKSWLWHRRLSHLNFGILNKLAKDSLARDIPRLKFQKDHLCSAYTLGKSKKSSHQPKAEDTNQEKLYLLHMDLCESMRVAVFETLREFYENVGISHQTYVARTPQQNGVVKRQNRTLIEVARTMLIFSKAPLFLWAEAINTSCYTQNCSLICLQYNKTPYELMQDKKPYLAFFYVFGALCYPTNDDDDLGKLDAKADIGLIPNTVSQQHCIPPNKDDWDHLFQPMFDEYFNPPTFAVSSVPVAAAPRAVDLADSLLSTSIGQDAPSASIPSTQEQEHSPSISQGFKESPKTLTFHDDPLNESPHEDSTSQGSSSNVLQLHTPFEHLGRWTEDW